MFHEPSESHRAEKEATDVQLQEKNVEIERLKKQAMRVSSLCTFSAEYSLHYASYIVLFSLGYRQR